MSELVYRFDDPAAQEVWETLRELNQCWTRGSPDDLRFYFHPRMIGVSQTERERLDNASACIAGWRGFAKMAKIVDWREIDPNVQVYDNAAVVAYYFDMHFELGEQTLQSTGRALGFFVKEDGRWLMVGDQLSEYPF